MKPKQTKLGLSLSIYWIKNTIIQIGQSLNQEERHNANTL